MNTEYVFKRIVRSMIPTSVFRFMLNHRILMKPGRETGNPSNAVNRYEQYLAAEKIELKDKSVLIFGYGGSFASSKEFLSRGAKAVYAYDKYEKPYEDIPQNVVVINDLKNVKADIIVSTSVFEHVTHLDEAIEHLSYATEKNGINLHFIDMRDHFFKYPFEMLCYHKILWESFLNSSLNRLRISDYQENFCRHFVDVTWKAVSTDLENFKKTKNRIRQEFLTGDDLIDAITSIVIIARTSI